MFPHRNLIEEDSFDEGNEASDLFNKKAKEMLRKLAPTKEERAIMSAPRGPPPLSSVRKKLNFDESFSFDAPSIGRQRCQLAEYEEQLEKMKRRNEILEKDLQLANNRNEELIESSVELRSQITSLKQQLSEVKIDQRNNSIQDESLLDQFQVEDICKTANKYISWFNTAITQLRAAEEILTKNKLMTRENKQKLIEAERVYPVEKDATDIAAFAVGSVMDFPGLYSLRIPDQELPSDDTRNTTRPDFSPIRQESEFVEPADILNSTLNASISSVDLENKEKITRLEQQNSLLVDKLKISSYRAQRALVLEEEKRSLEQKVEMLEQRLQEAMTEVAHLRKINAEQMFEQIPDGEEYGMALNKVDHLKQIEMKCTNLEEQLAEASRHIHHLEKCLENRDASVESLNHQLEYLNQRLHESEKEKVTTAREQQSQQPSSSNLASGADTTVQIPTEIPYKGTDAGDTTQIFHMVDNPLQQAHNLLLEEERTRKRKASGNLPEECEAKRYQEEEMTALRRQLERTEKERETQQKIHEDTLQSLKKFREITTFLTGYQIKVTDFDEGLVTVSSIYDENNKNFVFKVGSQNVDLLDLGYSASQTLSWDDLARHYISERSSVPAFLAKVTLTLEEKRDLEIAERTQTFSVPNE